MPVRGIWSRRWTWPDKPPDSTALKNPVSACQHGVFLNEISADLRGHECNHHHYNGEHHEREDNRPTDFVLLGFVVIMCHAAKIAEAM